MPHVNAMGRVACLVLVLVLTACTDSTPASSTPEASDAEASEGVAMSPEFTEADGESESTASPMERPETVQDTIIVEGMDEPITLRLVRFTDVPLPFSTYVPEDWTTDVLGSDEGVAAQMTTGEPPYQGRLTLFMPSGEPTVEEIVELAQSVADSYGNAQPMEAPADWVRRGLTFRDGETIGTVQVGVHNGNPFYLLEAFSAEMGDGFGPGSAVALARLRWEDDGSGL